MPSEFFCLLPAVFLSLLMKAVIYHCRAKKALSSCSIFCAFSVCFIPLCLTLITGLGACSLYLCRYLSPEPFALCAFNCLLMGVGPRAASAVGNEPSLTGLAFQQPLCPLRGFSVAVHSLTQGY